MNYLSHNKLADWRNKNKPTRCPLVEYKTSNWVVDHNHTSGFVRGVVSSEGNVLLGRIETPLRGFLVTLRRLLCLQSYAIWLTI